MTRSIRGRRRHRTGVARIPRPSAHRAVRARRDQGRVRPANAWTRRASREGVTPPVHIENVPGVISSFDAASEPVAWSTPRSGLAYTPVADQPELVMCSEAPRPMRFTPVRSDTVAPNVPASSRQFGDASCIEKGMAPMPARLRA